MRSVMFFCLAGLQRWLVIIVAVFCATGLVGCAGSPDPTVAIISVTAAADANPDAQGRASPVMLRVYELRSRAGFDGADFFSLYSADRQTLAADLAGKHEQIVTPGASAEIRRAPAPDVRYIGIVAAFRDIERARWRAAVELAPNQTTLIQLRVERNGLAVTTTPQ